MAKSNRTGRRKAREDFQKRIPDLGYYIIFTDTKETEENYMNGLKNSLPAELCGRIVIRVLKSKTDKLVEACKKQWAADPQYRQPWIIFDRDQVVNFNDIIENAKQEEINVGWSNPCIEIWFDAYFGKMHNYQDSVSCCEKYGNTFKHKTGQEYKKSSSKIYDLLTRYGDETLAINIAQKRHEQYLKDGIDKPSAMCPCTTIYKLVEEIRKKADCTNP